MVQQTRLSLLGLGLLAAPLTAAAATPVPHETVVHNTWTYVDVALNHDSVLCSSADYGALYLKIGMPELARITLLDHQNIGAGAPCVQAGVCEPGHMPEDLIDSTKPTERVHINVKAVRLDEPDEATHTCTTTLIERVHLTVRGIKFTHERQSPLGSRRYEDCLTTAATDTKTDDDDTDEPEVAPETTGCSATTPATSSFALLGVGMLALRRRRRGSREASARR